MKIQSLEESYENVIEKGEVIPCLELDNEKIKSVIYNIEKDIISLSESEKQENVSYNIIFKNYYDVFHQLAELFLQFDNKKAKYHNSLFAYLCYKYPELEFNWEFLERIRTIRNNSMYYFKNTDKEEWKSVELQLKLYIKTLKDEIVKKSEN